MAGIGRSLSLFLSFSALPEQPRHKPAAMSASQYRFILQSTGGNENKTADRHMGGRLSKVLALTYFLSPSPVFGVVGLLVVEPPLQPTVVPRNRPRMSNETIFFICGVPSKFGVMDRPQPLGISPVCFR